MCCNVSESANFSHSDLLESSVPNAGASAKDKVNYNKKWLDLWSCPHALIRSFGQVQRRKRMCWSCAISSSAAASKGFHRLPPPRTGVDTSLHASPCCYDSRFDLVSSFSGYPGLLEKKYIQYIYIYSYIFFLLQCLLLRSRMNSLTIRMVILVFAAEDAKHALGPVPLCRNADGYFRGWVSEHMETQFLGDADAFLTSNGHSCHSCFEVLRMEISRTTLVNTFVV